MSNESTVACKDCGQKGHATCLTTGGTGQSSERICPECGHDMTKFVFGNCAEPVRDAGGSLVYCCCRCPATAEAVASPFKVGDRVRYIKEIRGSWPEATVTEITEDGFCYKFDKPHVLGTRLGSTMGGQVFTNAYGHWELAEAQSIAEPEPAEKFEFNDPEASLRREPSLTMKIGEGGHSDFFHTAKVEPELLPCPMNHPPDIEQSVRLLTKVTTWSDISSYEATIQCLACGLSLRKGGLEMEDAIRNVTEVWNTRSRPTETAEVRRQVWDEAIAIAKAEAYERRMAYCVVAVLEAARDAAPAPSTQNSGDEATGDTERP